MPGDRGGHAVGYRDDRNFVPPRGFRDRSELTRIRRETDDDDRLVLAQ